MQYERRDIHLMAKIKGFEQWISSKSLRSFYLLNSKTLPCLCPKLIEFSFSSCIFYDWACHCVHPRSSIVPCVTQYIGGRSHQPARTLLSPIVKTNVLNVPDHPNPLIEYLNLLNTAFKIFQWHLVWPGLNGVGTLYK